MPDPIVAIIIIGLALGGFFYTRKKAREQEAEPVDPMVAEIEAHELELEELGVPSKLDNYVDPSALRLYDGVDWFPEVWGPALAMNDDEGEGMVTIYDWKAQRDRFEAVVGPGRGRAL